MKEDPILYPLVVDLDNTLIKTDCFFEAFFFNLKKNFFGSLFYIIVNLFNKTKIKARFFSNYLPNLNLIPVNINILNFIQEEHKTGRKIYLCSGSPNHIVKYFSQKFELFSNFYGTDNINLVGHNKKKFLDNLFGSNKYDYIGDSFSDITVWKSSNKAYLASNNFFLKFLLKSKKIIFIPLYKKRSYFDLLYDLFKLIRVHHWSKNILLFLPIFLAQDFSSISMINCLFAFFSFSLIASSIYIINDYLDLENDRSHPEKKNRVMPSGKVSFPISLGITFIFLITSIIVSFSINLNFLSVIVLYVLFNFTYSIIVKNIILLDIVFLSFFYVARVIAGGLATETYISIWLLLFCFFFFLFLANIKRITELRKIDDDDVLKKIGRKYTKSNLSLLKFINISSITASQLVLFIYFFYDSSLMLYNKSNIILIISFILSIWAYYISKKAFNSSLSSDPIVFALKDRLSWICFSSIFFLVISQMELWQS